MCYRYLAIAKLALIKCNGLYLCYSKTEAMIFCFWVNLDKIRAVTIFAMFHCKRKKNEKRLNRTASDTAAFISVSAIVSSCKNYF